ncbi:nuclear transport factor 2 family protein [Candidatus Gottesmanbacteria bacterium]|nr:nuclear transport factor 2 family protein [Candidatus Gottesmanbacteria bacterium]
MTRQKVRKLIENYTKGWIKNDFNLIISTLSPNCKIIESHGPVYKGFIKIKSWINSWINSGSYVTKWDITSFYFIKNTAFFEWYFECVVDNKKHKLEGISVVKFKDNKISFIREYRTTKQLFDWKR